MAGRKVFTSGEILTAADVNSFLMDQVVAVFADDAARSSAIPSPSEGMVTYREDANRVEVFDGSAFAPVGTILQVVGTVKTDVFTTTSTSFADITGLAATITPQSTTSKILVMASIQHSVSGTDVLAQMRLERGATPIFVGDSPGSRTQAFNQVYAFNTNYQPANAYFNAAPMFLDSPNTTSPVTYKATARTNTGIYVVNRGQDDADQANRSRAASSITLLEVAG